jgi:hypothetical protein
MVAILSSFAQIAPTLYYGFKTIGQLVVPSLIKSKSGPTLSAKSFFPEFFEKVSKVRDDVLVYKSRDLPHPAAAVSPNFGPTALIFYDEGFPEQDESALKWCFKHELSHIKDSDIFKIGTIATTTSAITAYAAKAFLPWWLVPCCSVLVAGNIFTFCSFYCEMKADKFANEHATCEELLGGERYLEGLLEANMLLHKRYPRLFSKEGNAAIFIDPYSMPTTVRLKIVRKEIEKRKVIRQDT